MPTRMETAMNKVIRREPKRMTMSFELITILGAGVNRGRALTLRKGPTLSQNSSALSVRGVW